MAHIEFNTYKELKQYIAKDSPREGKYTVAADETMQNKKSVYNYMNGELMLDSGGTHSIHWVAGVGTYADIVLTHLVPIGLDAVVVTADETHSDNKTWYIYNGDTEVWDYQGPYYKQEAQEFTSLSDTRADIITGELDLGFDYIVGENELDLYIDGNHSNYLLKEVGDLGFTSTKVSFNIDVPIHVDLVIRKVVSRVDDEPHTNPEVYVNAFKSNYDAIERFVKYQKSNVITYDTFADAQNDSLLVKEGQVILTLGHATKNDGKGRHWIVESTDKDFGYNNKAGDKFLNRLIKADEVQIGHLYPLAGNETAPPETVKPTGQIANRADFKRVWAWAVATGRVVTEAEWSAGNQGCFSSGDGSTTFRFPLAKDFIRAKESGRNVGSFQDDAIRNITGYLNNVFAETNASAGDSMYLNNNYSQGNWSSGVTNRGWSLNMDASRVVPTAAENRPKNIAQQYFMKI